jgi:hypothetical protein
MVSGKELVQMTEIESLRKEIISEEKSCFKQILIFIVFAFLIGFLAGFLAHDHLVQFTPDHLDRKSWYPR